MERGPTKKGQEERSIGFRYASAYFGFINQRPKTTGMIAIALFAIYVILSNQRR